MTPRYRPTSPLDHALLAGRRLVGGALVADYDIAEIPDPAPVWSWRHRQLLDALRVVTDRAGEPDLLEIASELRECDQYEQTGGVVELLDCLLDAPRGAPLWAVLAYGRWTIRAMRGTAPEREPQPQRRRTDERRHPRDLARRVADLRSPYDQRRRHHSQPRVGP